MSECKGLYRWQKKLLEKESPYVNRIQKKMGTVGRKILHMTTRVLRKML